MEEAIKEATVTSQETASRWFPIGLGIGMIMMVGLLYGMTQLVFVGHHALGTTKEVPWGIFIINYAWAISSIGLSYIASFGIVLGIRQFDVIGRRALYLALVIVVAGVMSVAADLAQPLHAPFLILTGHYSAPMGVVATSITLYMALIAVELYLVIKRGHHDILVKTVAIAAFVAAVIVHSYHGAIFGLPFARSYWYGPYYPIYFLLSALFTSSALIIFITVATYKAMGQQMSKRLQDSLSLIGQMLVYLLIIASFFLYWKIVSGHYAHKQEAYAMLTGRFAVFFWIGEVLMTYLVPIGILIWSKFRDFNKMAVAGLLVAVGLYFGRYDFIVGGQIDSFLAFTPFDSDLGGSFSTLASYTPSLTEITYSIGLLGFIWTGYILGIKYLPLHIDEEETVEELESEPLISVYKPRLKDKQEA
ncbi:MAG: NrfD/PsrC family molybdoenzyme membrane anchor subunit [Dissulfurispiraceae bacterium]|jgi:Ni/Fe-hydrogenase subunit HybB-like protein